MQFINNGALSIAYPLAKTLAIKDACDLFGKLFGSDLNRRDSLPASMDKVPLTAEEQHKEIKELLNEKEVEMTADEVMQIERVLDKAEIESYTKAIKFLKTK